MSADGGKGKTKKSPGKRRSLSREVKEEPDPEWRQWFQSVEQRKKDYGDPKRRPWVFSAFDKENESGSVVRRRSVPLELKKFIKSDRKKAGSSLDVDLLRIESAWKTAVGEEIVNESGVYSFKNGVLTITVFSSSLLQEIRQFHQSAILRDLRDIWTASQPLVRIQYRLGKR